ncbi:MAG TPA: hypothetical protein PLI95_28800, partial [Polyangiaceae bacterium]|nr:hypothetical protein [Polyangiaceae bacterium]
MLVHLTEAKRIESIRAHGLLSPAKAAALGFAQVLGSTGSNQEVVQLLDLARLETRAVIDNLDGLINSPDANDALVSGQAISVLVLDPMLRDDP